MAKCVERRNAKKDENEFSENLPSFIILKESKRKNSEQLQKSRPQKCFHKCHKYTPHSPDLTLGFSVEGI